MAPLCLCILWFKGQLGVAWSQRTPSWEIPNYKPYITWVFMGYFIPKNPQGWTPAKYR